MDASRSFTRSPAYLNFVFIVSRRVLWEIRNRPSLGGRARFGCLRHVCFFSELRGVQARVLRGRADWQEHEKVDDPQDRVGAAEGERRDDDAGEGLNSQLPWIAEEQTVRAGRVNHGRREEARGNRPPETARSVAGKDVEGVVQGRPGPPAADVVAKYPRDQSDEDRRHRADVSRGGRDRDETAHRSNGHPYRGRLPC